MPEWTLSTEDGKIHRFRDLNTLQKWIVERKVTRNEKISRAGGSWLALGDVVELAPFFSVIDEADRARATGASQPSTGRRGFFALSINPRHHLPTSRRSAARQPISEDGPTVPNRRLPGMADPPRSAARPAHARSPGSLGFDAQASPGIPAPGIARRPAVAPADSRAFRARVGQSSGASLGARCRPFRRRAARPIARTELALLHHVTEEARGTGSGFPAPESRGPKPGSWALRRRAGGWRWILVADWSSRNTQDRKIRRQRRIAAPA